MSGVNDGIVEELVHHSHSKEVIDIIVEGRNKWASDGSLVEVRYSNDIVKVKA